MSETALCLCCTQSLLASDGVLHRVLKLPCALSPLAVRQAHGEQAGLLAACWPRSLLTTLLLAMRLLLRLPLQQPA